MNKTNYFCPIFFRDLGIMQQKILASIPDEFLQSTCLTYKVPNIDQSLNAIPEFKTQMEEMDLNRYVRSVAVCIIHKGAPATIHVDSGIFRWSLNFPILNCKNSKVNFFSTKIDPILVAHEHLEVTHHSYTEENCNLETSLEMMMPYIIDTKTPHNVINYNNSPRVTLLVRLKQPDFEEHPIFKKHLVRF
jgi:hypothetical protein